jgi:hypothetical protein
VYGRAGSTLANRRGLGARGRAYERTDRGRGTANARGNGDNSTRVDICCCARQYSHTRESHA